MKKVEIKKNLLFVSRKHFFSNSLFSILNTKKLEENKRDYLNLHVQYTTKKYYSKNQFDKQRNKTQKLEKEINEAKEKLKSTKFEFDENLSNKEPEEIISNINSKYEKLRMDETEEEYIGKEKSGSNISKYITYFLIFFFPYYGYMYFRKKGEIKEDFRQANLKKNELLRELVLSDSNQHSVQNELINNFSEKIKEKIGKKNLRVEEAKKIQPITNNIVNQYLNNKQY